MAKKKKQNSITNVIYIICLVLFVGVLICGVLLFSSKVSSDSGSVSVANGLFVTYDNTQYSGIVKNFNMNNGEAYRFEVKQYTGMLQGDSLQDYTVSVLVNNAVQNRFYFTVDGSIKQFIALGDVSSAFDIVINDKYFTITAPSGGVPAVLAALYPGKTVDILDNYIFLQSDYFKLKITSGSESVYVLFDTAIDVTEISVSEETIAL